MSSDGVIVRNPSDVEIGDLRAGASLILAALAETLEKNQLPPFDVLVPYFAPGGGILYDTDNGYHGISFTLRSQTEK